MKIIAIILIVIGISLVNMMNAERSARYRPDPAEPHLLDVLKYMCTDVVPSMDHLNFFDSRFGELRMGLLPVCNYVIKEADSPSGFDATKFCNFLVDYLQLGELMHASHGHASGDFNGPKSPLLGLLYRKYKVTANVIQNLYGMDLEDPTTICPHAQRLFQPKLYDMYDDYLVEYYTELISVLIIPELDSICHDWKGYFASLGVPDSSPYQRLVGSIIDINSDIFGYESLEDMCQRYEEIFKMDWPARRLFSKMLAKEIMNKRLRLTSQIFGRSKQTPTDKKTEL